MDGSRNLQSGRMFKFPFAKLQLILHGDSGKIGFVSRLSSRRFELARGGVRPSEVESMFV